MLGNGLLESVATTRFEPVVQLYYDDIGVSEPMFTARIRKKFFFGTLNVELKNIESISSCLAQDRVDRSSGNGVVWPIGLTNTKCICLCGRVLDCQVGIAAPETFVESMNFRIGGSIALQQTEVLRFRFHSNDRGVRIAVSEKN